MAHAELRAAEHQERVLEARRRGAIDLEVADGQLARAQLDGGEVLDIDGAVARQPRAHEQRHVVAPGHERLLEDLSLARPCAMSSEKPLGSSRRKASQVLHVDAAEQERDVDAVVDVALVDVGLEGGLRARDQVGIACRVDDGLGVDRVAAFLALEDGALDDVAFEDGMRAPGVQQQAHLGLGHHLHGGGLEGLGIDGRRPGDDAVVGGGALGPVGGGARRPWSPSRRAWAPGSRPWAVDPSGRSAMPQMTCRPDQSDMRSIQITRPPVERPPRWL